jgi:hypothetical protein
MELVHFEPIVPVNSRLRELPLFLDPEMRLRIDALVYAADAISINWHRMKSAAARVGAAVSEMDHYTRAEILSSAWSIVDELDAVRQLVGSLAPLGTKRGPHTAKLLETCEPVNFLRNRLRHLAQNLTNISNAKGRRNPMFGALSWLWCPDPESGKAHVLIMQSGALHGEVTMTVLNPAGKTFSPPADLFQLNAFDRVLELGVPIKAFADWLNASSTAWLQELESKINEYVEKTGEDPTKLWEHSAGGLTVAMAIEFGESSTPPNGSGSRE